MCTRQFRILTNQIASFQASKCDFKIKLHNHTHVITIYIVVTQELLE